MQILVYIVRAFVNISTDILLIFLPFRLVSATGGNPHQAEESEPGAAEMRLPFEDLPSTASKTIQRHYVRDIVVE